MSDHSRPLDEARVDDLDALERRDVSDGGTPSAAELAGAAFDDPEALSDAEYSEAERELDRIDGLDLEQEMRSVFGRADDKVTDVVDAWLSLHRKHPQVPDAQIEAWFRISRGPDAEAAREAEDKIVRHNVRLIWDAAVKAARGAMTRGASDLREDVLGQAGLGFTEALRCYNPDKAPRGREWAAKSILGYSYVRIKKHVKMFLAKTQSGGLSQEQFRDYGLVKRAVQKLADEAMKGTRATREGGLTPQMRDLAEQVQDVLEAEARLRAERAGEAVLSEPVLRKYGALRVERIRTFLAYSTSALSLDQGGAEDDDERKLGDSVSDEGATVGDELLDEDTLASIQEAVFGTAPVELETKQLQIFAAAGGLLGATGRARYPRLFPEELGRMAGRTPDSIAKYEAQTRRALMGEAGEDLEWVRRPRVPITVAEARERLQAGTLGADVLDKLRAAISMRELLEASGVVFPSLDEDAAQACPFPDCGSDGFTLEDDERFACDACHREGDVFDWLETTRKVDRTAAVLEAIRIANRLPPELLFKENSREQIRVTKHPKRKDAVRRNLG